MRARAAESTDGSIVLPQAPSVNGARAGKLSVDAPAYTAPPDGPSTPFIPPMHCPACSSEFERLPHETLAIDRCTICRSLWFDSGAESDPEPSADGQAAALACPRCESSPMQPQRRRGVEYLRCPDCSGTYLSASSVRELRAQEPDPHAGYATPETELQTLFALIKRLF